MVVSVGPHRYEPMAILLRTAGIDMKNRNARLTQCRRPVSRESRDSLNEGFCFSIYRISSDGRCATPIRDGSRPSRQRRGSAPHKPSCLAFRSAKCIYQEESKAIDLLVINQTLVNIKLHVPFLVLAINDDREIRQRPPSDGNDGSSVITR